jgi:hypothetical protein
MESEELRLTSSFCEMGAEAPCPFLMSTPCGDLNTKMPFYPAIPMDFESQQFSIPNQFSKILSDLYGDYTQLPEEQDRTSSHMDYSQIKIRPYGENCVNLRNYL